MILKKNLYKLFSNISFCLITSCKLDKNYFPYNEGRQVFYDVFFQDKEKKNILDKVFSSFQELITVPVLKNDGE